ncbi:MAG: DMT family transporter [Novosphingobium sp.]|nr:DMT family transporter [Novosphingobium sp.]
MFATGVGIPIMASLNSALGQQLGSPAAATFALFVVGAVLSAVVLAVAGAPEWSRFTFERPWLYLGAAFILFYALSITWAAPKIGVGNAIFFVLLGQLAAAALIDHFGLLGALKFELTARRVAGLVVMAVGVYLAKRTA